jgi:hypothetical protein
MCSGCTDTGDTVIRNIRFKNSASQSVQILCYNQNVLAASENISPNAFGRDYNTSATFLGFTVFDSIVMKFPLNKGYICSLSDNTICFPDKGGPLSLDANDFIKEGSNYYYDITEEDYQNAFDL